MQWIYIHNIEKMVQLKQAQLKVYLNICYTKVQQLLRNECVRTCLLIILIFIISPLLILYLSKSYYTKNLTSNRSIQILRSFFRFTSNDIKFSGCTNFDCNFICTNTTDINNAFLIIFNETNCTAIENIHIERQDFLNGTLTKNWLLSNYTIRLHELQILSSNIELIENEAFNTEIYTETFSFTIQNSKLYKLTAGILLGLSQLEYLTIISEIREINRGFFQPIRASLHFLKLNEMTDSIKFENIFGISNMTNLIHLDLSLNNFYQIINGEIFKQLPVIRYLNLSKSNITSIAENAFDYAIDTLKYLDLSYNHLTHISNLQNILIDRQIYIYLRENKWNCNCKLQSMARTFIEYKDMFMDIPYCKLPHKFYGEMINAVGYNNCNNSEVIQFDSSPKPITTTTEISIINKKPNSNLTIDPEFIESTTKISDFSSTESINIDETPLPVTLLPEIEKFFRLRCFSQSSDYEDIPENFINQTSLPPGSEIFQHISILPPFYEFNLELLANNSVLITIEKFKDNLSVLWYDDPENIEFINSFNNNNNSNLEYGCQYYHEHNKTILIEDLKHNCSYTFCLIPDGKVNITPFNCLPLYIPEILIENNSNFDNVTTWISSEDKNWTVAVICIILTISMFLGGLIAYFILKFNPDLLEGSKHVLVVKKSCNEEKSTNSSVSIISEPSLELTSDNYLTENTEYNNLKNRVSLIPLTIRENIDTDSAYETPVDLDFNDNNDYMEHINENYKYSPPSLPDRCTEHIYGRIDSPIIHYKRSI